MLRLVTADRRRALTDAPAHRAQELDADDDERVARVIAALVERRLLVVDDESVELVHEALLERWPSDSSRGSTRTRRGGACTDI